MAHKQADAIRAHIENGTDPYGDSSVGIRPHAINMLPYLAYAIADSPGAHRRLARHYDKPDDARRLYAAAWKTGEALSPAITSGRAQVYIAALRALGVLADGNTPDILSLLRAANGRLYQRVSAYLDDGQPVDTKDILRHIHRATQGDDDQMVTDILLAFGVVVMRNGAFDSEQIKHLLSSYAYNRFINKQAGEDVPDAEKNAARMFYGVSSVEGATGLYAAAPDDARATLDDLSLLLAASGISIDDYTRRVALDLDDLARCHQRYGDTPLAWLGAQILMVLKASAQDRDYLISADKSREIGRLAAEHEEARAKAKEATAAADAQARQIDQLRQQVEQLHLRADKAEAAHAARSGDAQELASLRSALWQAQHGEGDVAPEQQAERDLPDGILCLGGHATWAAQMQQELPQVTFIHADASWQDSQVRNASELWFNLGVMNHAQYYRAINLARQHNVPVNYFGSLSVPNSIRQLRQAP